MSDNLHAHKRPLWPANIYQYR